MLFIAQFSQCFGFIKLVIFARLECWLSSPGQLAVLHQNGPMFNLVPVGQSDYSYVAIYIYHNYQSVCGFVRPEA